MGQPPPPDQSPPPHQPPYGSAPGYGPPPPGQPYGPVPGQPGPPPPYPHQPAPGWPPGAPGPVGPSAGQNKTAVIIVAVVTAVVVLCGGATLVAYGLGAFGRDDGPLAQNSPERVVRDFLAAYREADCAGMIDLTTAGFWRDSVDSRQEAIQECEDGLAFFAGFNLRVEETRTVSRDRDWAVVEADVVAGREPSTETFTLQRQGGRWLIDEWD